MKSIRSKVFETNSSSSHSLTCSKDVLTQSELIPKKYAVDGRLPITLRDYGWEYYRYYLFMNKVSYLATQLFNGQDEEFVRNYDVRESINRGSDALAMLHRAVYNLTGCEVYYPQETGFSIDHESVGNGSELYRDIKVLEEFLINEASYIETGNDNSQPPWTIGTDKGMMNYYNEYLGSADKSWPLLSFKKAEYKDSFGGKVSLFGKNGIVLGAIQGADVLEKIISNGVVEAIVKRSSPGDSKYGSSDSRKGEAVDDLLKSLEYAGSAEKTISFKIDPQISYEELTDASIERWNAEIHFQVRVPPEVFAEYDRLEPADLHALELSYCKSQLEHCRENLNEALTSGSPSSSVDYYSKTMRSLEERVKQLESR